MGQNVSICHGGGNVYLVDSGTGKVGIGSTDIPAALLHVSSGNGTTAIRVAETTGAHSVWEMRAYNGTTSAANYFSIWGGEGTDLDDRIFIRKNGNVGINLEDPEDVTDELTVNGTIRTEELILETDLTDYVFGSGYDLMSLDEVEEYIDENSHLPGVPSAEDVDTQELSIADSQNLLLQKVEELTLYTIEQNKQLKSQREEIEQLRKMISAR
jgi:hypothetical protein